MGCDIHLVVEYRRRKERTVTGELKWKDENGNPLTFTYTLDSKWRTVIQLKMNGVIEYTECLPY